MRSFTYLALLAILLAGLLLGGCAKKTPPTSSTTTPSKPVDPVDNAREFGTKTNNKLVELPSGLKYIDVKTGTGETAVTGDMVEMEYSGWFNDGIQFDSNVKGMPLTFKLGGGMVIKGWDEGIQGMKVGGIRKLIIPPQLAYGEKGTGDGKIPPKSTLIFEVRLLKIN
jgi:FKBP-type peptidyl-prolyl cis-trans isomerase